MKKTQLKAFGIIFTILCCINLIAWQYGYGFGVLWVTLFAGLLSWILGSWYAKQAKTQGKNSASSFSPREFEWIAEYMKKGFEKHNVTPHPEVVNFIQYPGVGTLDYALKAEPKIVAIVNKAREVLAKPGMPSKITDSDTAVRDTETSGPDALGTNHEPRKSLTQAHAGSFATASPDEISVDNQKKKCPACAEIIKLEAKKCRFCMEKFDPDDVNRVVENRKAELAKKVELEAQEEAEKIKQGRKKCQECGSWDVRRAIIEDGGMGDWCPNCQKSLKFMGLA